MLEKQNKVYKVLKRINFILGLIILALAAYLIGSPYLPHTGFIANAKEWIKDEVLHVKRNKILINTIGVNGEILEGTDSELNMGFWRIPYSSIPSRGGNTVIAAHRFLYNYGPNTFFNLDKVVVGNKIQLLWEDKTYNYVVTEVKVISSSENTIEDNTSNSILTLYTCTSLTDNSQRLVVIGKLIEG